MLVRKGGVQGLPAHQAADRERVLWSEVCQLSPGSRDEPRVRGHSHRKRNFYDEQFPFLAAPGQALPQSCRVMIT